MELEQSIDVTDKGRFVTRDELEKRGWTRQMFDRVGGQYSKRFQERLLVARDENGNAIWKVNPDLLTLGEVLVREDTAEWKRRKKHYDKRQQEKRIVEQNHLDRVNALLRKYEPILAAYGLVDRDELCGSLGKKDHSWVTPDGASVFDIDVFFDVKDTNIDSRYRDRYYEVGQFVRVTLIRTEISGFTFCGWTRDGSQHITVEKLTELLSAGLFVAKENKIPPDDDDTAENE